MRNLFFTISITAVLAFGSASAKEPIRLDASSDASAEATWNQMTGSASSEKKQALLIAMLKLNMAGVKSAYEVVDNPELQSFGIARVKDKVAGLTAEEIIDLANRASSVTVESQTK